MFTSAKVIQQMVVFHRSLVIKRVKSSEWWRWKSETGSLRMLCITDDQWKTVYRMLLYIRNQLSIQDFSLRYAIYAKLHLPKREFGHPGACLWIYKGRTLSILSLKLFSKISVDASNSWSAKASLLRICIFIIFVCRWFLPQKFYLIMILQTWMCYKLILR